MANTAPSVCPLDCPDTCSLSITVDDGRLLKVRGSKVNPLTRGAICAKVTRYPEFVHGPGRLRTPLRRTGVRGEGAFEAISWDDALNSVHEGFQRAIGEYGPQSIVPFNYAGPHGMLAGGSMDRRFFNRLGASQLARSPLCGGIKSEAFVGTYGKVPLMRPEDVAHARLIIVWGLNVTVSQLHLMAPIREATRAGGKLVVIDPRRTPVAKKADLHIANLPGTDVLLAFALAAELERNGGLDRDFINAHVKGADAFLAQARQRSVEDSAAGCGVNADTIKQLAGLYRDSSPAVICPGNGPERNQNGGSGLRAIFALPALAGKFGVRGGGLLQGASHAFPVNAARLEGADMIPPGTRTLNIVTLGKAMLDPELDPPIKAVFIYNHNPVIVHPDQNTMKKALLREDLFIVASDIVMTDSVKYADVVLPACSHFEHKEVFKAYGQHYLQRAEPVIPPVDEALPNTEIFRRVAKRFGFNGPAFETSDDELIDDAFDADDQRLDGRRAGQIGLEEALLMRIDGKPAMLFDSTSPKTPSGKVELESEYLQKNYGQSLPGFRPVVSEYPLALISPGSDERTTSTFGGLETGREEVLEMHPADAAARGLEHGALVRVYNDLGEVRLMLCVTEVIRVGVVCAFKGAWMRTSGNGQTISSLAPSHLADLCKGACYNDARVEVTAVNA
ncbi:MAG: molybdopterin-dependent oxidoreductase [Gammaproteobacteria bacterium]|nr:molybdopterin-dependent oxidoreductase [Gammaproteobacteria bacterium]MDH3413271.1 molybdopterin-dependent oxidoreductase [Gammaproteobacteria bacterium]